MRCACAYTCPFTFVGAKRSISDLEVMRGWHAKTFSISRPHDAAIARDNFCAESENV